MPVLILRERCDNLPHCFAATACPNQAIFYDEGKGQVVVLPERCGDCRGPCLNFCDRYALKYAPSLEELRLLQAELDGTMSPEEIAQARLRLKQAEEARRGEAVPEVTAEDFRQEVLQSRLPVLVMVDSPRFTVTKRLLPVLEQMAQQYVGRLVIRRLNGDAEPDLAAALRVRVIPTFLLFYQGQLVDGVEGAFSPAQLQQWIEQALEQVQAPAGRPTPGPTKTPARPRG
ncbi:MAG: thioredoxin domain-containing protein [Chloroflexia bacterium]